MPRAPNDLVRSTGFLFFAALAAGLASVAYLGLATRALTLSDLGRFAAVVALILVSDNLFGFGTWKAVVHFGAGFKPRKSSSDWLRLGSLGLLLDFFGAIIAGVFAFLVLAFSSFEVFDFGDNLLVQVAVFIPLLSSGYPTALGVLRVKKRLHMQVSSIVAGPLITLGIFFLLWRSDAPTVGDFIVGWVIGLTASRLIIALAGFGELRKLSGPLKFQEIMKTSRKVDAGMLRFLWFAKLDSTVLAMRGVDIILVAYILGPESTGLYKVVRQVASLVARASSPLGEAFMPVASSMRAESNHTEAFWLAMKSALWSGMLMLVPLFVFLVVGRQALAIAFGDGLEAAYLPAAIALFAMVLFAAAQPLEPLLLSWGNSGTVASLGLVTVFLYLGTLLMLAGGFGLAGAIASLLIFHSCHLLLLLVWSFRLRP